MRRARCTLDNITYTAIDFYHVDNFETKRQNLVCTECSGRAIYRRAGRDGRVPCFVGRPHTEGCQYVTIELEGNPEGQGGAEDEILTTGQRIVVNFNQGTAAVTTETQPTGGNANAGAHRRHNGGGTVQRPVTNRCLGRILCSLIESEEFRRSTQPIVVVGQEYRVGDLFVNFAEVTADHVGRYKGFWGVITGFEIDDNNSLWLNSGAYADMSILLDERHAEFFSERYDIETINDLFGAYVLVFGELRRSRNNKKYVEVTDLCYLALRLTPRNDDIRVEWVD
jgi:hypothetical protein